jgi:hypothetical protein
MIGKLAVWVVVFVLTQASVANAKTVGFPAGEQPKFVIDMPGQGWSLQPANPPGSTLNLSSSSGVKMSFSVVPNGMENWKAAVANMKAFVNKAYVDVNLDEGVQYNTSNGLSAFAIHGTGRLPNDKAESNFLMAWLVIDDNSWCQVWFATWASNEKGKDEGLQILDSVRPGQAVAVASAQLPQAPRPAAGPSFSGKSMADEQLKADIYEKVAIAFGSSLRCDIESIETSVVQVFRDDAGNINGVEELWIARGCGKSGRYRVGTTASAAGGVDISVSQANADQGG